VRPFDLFSRPQSADDRDYDDASVPSENSIVEGERVAPPAAADLLVRVASAALQALGSMTSSSQQDHGMDTLGEFLLFTDTTDGRCMKETCVALESALPWGRLIDLDVYDAAGRPVTRQALGLPERTCLVCDEPARDCMRFGRHSEAELRVRVEALLRLLATGLSGDN
jgi:holo-ACP synthase